MDRGDWARSRKRRAALQFSLHLAGLVALQHIALLDVVVAVDAHAAFLASADLLGVVFEALEFLEAAVLLDDNPPAGHADLAVALDHAIRDITSGDHAHLGNLEHRANLGVAEHFEFDLRIEQTFG